MNPLKIWTILVVMTFFQQVACSNSPTSQSSGRVNKKTEQSPDGKNSATVDKNEDTTVTTSEDSDLGAVEIEIPAGALDGDGQTEITIEEGSTLANDVTGSYLTFPGQVTPVSKSIFISANGKTEALKKEIRMVLQVKPEYVDALTNNSGQFQVFQLLLSAEGIPTLSLVPKEKVVVANGSNSFTITTSSLGVFQGAFSDSAPSNPTSIALMSYPNSKAEEDTQPQFALNSVDLTISGQTVVASVNPELSTYQDIRCSAKLKRDGSMFRFYSFPVNQLSFSISDLEVGTYQAELRCLSAEHKISTAVLSREIYKADSHLVFVTSSKYEGDMGPIAGNDPVMSLTGSARGDFRCSEAAQSFSDQLVKKRIWKAILFGTGEDPAGETRFSKFNNFSGSILNFKGDSLRTGANSFPNLLLLTDLSIRLQYETGMDVPAGSIFWIGTKNTGGSNANCNQWSNKTGLGDSAANLAGVPLIDQGNGERNCSLAFHLLCISL